MDSALAAKLKIIYAMPIPRRDAAREAAVIDIYKSEGYTFIDVAKIFCTNCEEVSNILRKYHEHTDKQGKRKSKLSNVKYTIELNEKDIIMPIQIISTLLKGDRYSAPGISDPKLYNNGELVLSKSFQKQFEIHGGNRSLKIHIAENEDKSKFILLEVVNTQVNGDQEYCKSIDGKTVHISLTKYLIQNGIRPKKCSLPGAKSESLFGKKFIVIPVPKELYLQN